MEKYLLLLLICLASLLLFNILSLFTGQTDPTVSQNYVLLYPENILDATENLCIQKCIEELKSPTKKSRSLCGPSASSRGDHQKVVSFCFYGEMKSGYYKGIKQNLMSMQNFYPNWTMRLYGDWTKASTNDPTDDICSLHCQHPDRLDICSVRSVPNFGDLHETFGMIWRFLPLADPTVDVMIVRDLDSRFSKREEAAVQEWISSDLPFHAMRDNPLHGTWILGGMWGARMDLGNREKYTQMLVNLIKKAGKGGTKGFDQSILSQVVWPVVKDEALVHDSYLCEHWKSKHLRPWPTRRDVGPANFVGSIGTMELTQDCPVACRPVEHQDWNMC